MIARARKAFPGMFVSLMLAIPASAHADPSRIELSPIPTAPSAGRAHIAKNEVRKPGATRRAGTRSAKATPPHNPSRVVIAADTSTWLNDANNWRQFGKASWYGGPRWHGRATSGGDRYDENALTAAHATLPLGSRVRVTVADSGRSVVVVINDRPGTRTRIIDLSRAAASELGILTRGVAMVSLATE